MEELSLRLPKVLSRERKSHRSLATPLLNCVFTSAFISPREFLTCTLLGSVTSHEICGSAVDSSLSVKPKWSHSAEGIFKVNAFVTIGNLVIIGGFQKDGGGIIEVWRKTSIGATSENAETK